VNQTKTENIIGVGVTVFPCLIAGSVRNDGPAYLCADIPRERLSVPKDYPLGKPKGWIAQRIRKAY